MMRKRLILKVVSSVLVFTFLFSQILYAADPRELLLLAKNSFNLEDQRRTGSIEPLNVQSQSLNEAEVDQQNIVAQQN